MPNTIPITKDMDQSFMFMSSISCQDNDGNVRSVDTKRDNDEVTFMQNYKYWNDSANFLSTNNFDNAYFNRIVEMGNDAVPFILAEIEKRPSQLVHALDCIYPGVVQYNGFVSIKEACEKWISILKQIKTN